MVDGLADALTHRPLIALVTLFGAGLVTSLTPCIYPMIPITAGILSGTSAGQPSRARTARLTLVYVTGLALFYAILGLFAGLSGSLRSEEHTSELQSRLHLVCRLLLEKKKHSNRLFDVI